MSDDKNCGPEEVEKYEDLCSAHAYCGSGSGMCANRKL